MKLSFAVLFAAVASVAAKTHKSIQVGQDGLKANSPLGQKILSKARRVEENADVYSMTWVEGFSLKFQGCHHVQQWNDEANEDADVRIATKRLVRFRLCPSDTCSSSNAGGCNAGYGDYVVDLNTFMDAYIEVTRQTTEYECEYYLENNCACEDDGSDDFDKDICQYDCLADAGLADACADKNPYEDDQQQQQQEFNLDEYMACGQIKFQNNNQRQLEDQVKYYLGPYCSEQGGSVFLGLFTDDSCSTFPDSSFGKETYLTMTGDALPYSEVSLIGSECVSCYNKQQAANNNGNNNNNNDQNYLMEQCQTIYTAAGKCESNLPAGTTNYPNEAACNYIAGVKVIRQDGMIFAKKKGSSAATAFIVIFALACGGLGYYVYLLRKKIQEKAEPLL